MKTEYGVINITAIKERINVLDKQYNELNDFGKHCIGDRIKQQIMNLEEFVSEYKPLKPILKKVFDDGKAIGIISYNTNELSVNKQTYNERKKEYFDDFNL